MRHLLGGSAKTADDVVRNSVLQQRHFLRLLGSVMSGRRRFLAELLIGTGLVLRICAGATAAAAGRGSMLLRTSCARLSDLVSKRSMVCA